MRHARVRHSAWRRIVTRRIGCSQRCHSAPRWRFVRRIRRFRGVYSAWKRNGGGRVARLGRAIRAPTPSRHFVRGSPGASARVSGGSGFGFSSPRLARSQELLWRRGKLRWLFALDVLVLSELRQRVDFASRFVAVHNRRTTRHNFLANAFDASSSVCVRGEDLHLERAPVGKPTTFVVGELNHPDEESVRGVRETRDAQVGEVLGFDRPDAWSAHPALRSSRTTLARHSGLNAQKAIPTASVRWCWTSTGTSSM